ncbi:MAG: excalibur calcium-binding domain-containing protein [Allosphingosinicella sp.]
MRNADYIHIAQVAALVFIAAWNVMPDANGAANVAARDTTSGPAPDPVYYSGCNEVRAAGKAPLYAGQPGYSEDMDGDGDGIACEPYHHRY